MQHQGMQLTSTHQTASTVVCQCACVLAGVPSHAQESLAYASMAERALCAPDADDANGFGAIVGLQTVHHLQMEEALITIPSQGGPHDGATDGTLKPYQPNCMSYLTYNLWQSAEP